MSKYTTGEIARLTGVSVRTVQYYDNRGILMPSELSEGGRRLYSDDDLKRMRIICFLRETGLPLNSIAALLSEKNPENIISILLNQQAAILQEELADRQAKLDMIEEIKREISELDSFSVESIADIAHTMKNKNKRRKMLRFMLLSGIPVTVLQWTSIVLWITHGLWWLFVLWGAVAIPWGIAVSVYYFSHIDFICPECHEEFRPKPRESFFAYHTPKMRRLTCPHCGRKGLCVEIYADKTDKENKNDG